MRITTLTATNAFRPTEATRLPARSEATRLEHGERRPGARQQVRFVVANSAAI